MRRGPSGAGKIGKETGKGDLCRQGLVRLCGSESMRMWLLHTHGSRYNIVCMRLNACKYVQARPSIPANVELFGRSIASNPIII